MPNLRLNQVLADKEAQITDEKVKQAIKSLRGNQKTGEIFIEKLDEEISEQIRVISEALNISIFDLFVPAEKFYRLKIFESLNESEYTGIPREKLTKLHSKLLKSIDISLNLLAVYATQALPESLLIKDHVQQICSFLDITEDNIKQEESPPKQTISIELLLKILGVTLDDLSVFLKIPKEYIGWLNNKSILIGDKNTNVSKLPNAELMPRRSFLLNRQDERTILCDFMNCLQIFNCNSCPNQ